MNCLACLLTLLALFSPPKLSPDGRTSAAAGKVAEACRTAIRAELTTATAPDWAGEYHEGDGMGENVSLLLAPRSGFVFEWHGCLGLYDRNYGAVEEVEGRLKLSFTFENVREGLRGLAPLLVPVRWAERHYLIPADDVIGFCNEINSGVEPRSFSNGRYLLRRGDEGKPATGKPELPAADLGALLAAPVNARVTAVGSASVLHGLGKSRFRRTILSLDAGRAAGLREGMNLYVTEPKNLVESIELTSVNEKTSEGVMLQSELDGIENPVPAPGWRLSTRPPWRPMEAAPPAR